MKNYELTYLISPTLSDDEAGEFQNKIASFMQENGGVLNNSRTPVKKRLAYSIKGQKVAFLATLLFQLAEEKIESLEKQLKEESDIIKYLILIKKIIKEDKKVPRIIKKTESKPKTKLKEFDEKLEEIINEKKE